MPLDTGYRLAAEVNRQHSECVCVSLYTHTLRVLPIHFGRETVPSAFRLHVGGVTALQFRHWLLAECPLLIRPAYGRYPIKFILPEFMSYLGGRGVLCVGNGSHFYTQVFMNMCNITFQVLRLSTFVFNMFKKCLVKIIITIIFVVKSLVGIMLA